MANIDEQHLNDLLAARVTGARVVHILGQGFWALIPHYRAKVTGAGVFTLAPHYLGERYADSLAMINLCWAPRGE